jgi:hypothetical protein
MYFEANRNYRKERRKEGRKEGRKEEREKRKENALFPCIYTTISETMLLPHQDECTW